MGTTLKMVGTICARGGSKGVPGKNVRPLLGEPLIAHSIKQLVASDSCEAIAVTSDSEQILEIAARYGVKHTIRRPAELSSDTAPKIPAIRHCVETVENELGTVFEGILDLDPTSPLRTVSDITQAIRLFIESGAPNVISATPARRSPYFNLVELNENGIARLSKGTPGTFLRRQDAPRCYDLNASIYVYSRKTLFSSVTVFNEGTRLYEMPEERSIDVDSELDFEIVKMLAEKRGELL